MSGLQKTLLAIGIFLGLPSCSTKRDLMTPKGEIKRGAVVLLNGTSTSGKSALVNELQREFGKAYEIVELDRYMGQLQEEHPLSESEQKSMKPEEMEKRVGQFLHYTYSHAKELSQQGKHVLVDTVQFNEEYERNCAALDCKNAVKILVYCPFDIVVDRVAKRTKEGSPRTLNLVLNQFLHAYKIRESDDELFVDCIETRRFKAKLALVKEEVERLPKEMGLKTEEEIQKFRKERLRGLDDFVKHFKLDSCKTIELTTRQQAPWDLVVNTGALTPAEAAQTVAAFVKKRGFDIKPILFNVDPKTFVRYTGLYRLETGLVLSVIKERDKFFVHPKGQSRVELFPASEHVFFNKVDEFEITFVENKDGKVTKLILHQDGKDHVAERVK